MTVHLAPADPASTPPARAETQPRSHPAAGLLAALIGAGLGTGQLWGGLYSVRSWGPVAIVAIVVAIALVIGSFRLPNRRAGVLIGALAGFAVLSALSGLWAESAPAAAFEAHRWAVYAVLALVTALVVRGEREQLALALGFLGASAAIALVLWVRLLTGAAAEQFLVMRLTEPLGYVNGQAASFVLPAWGAIAVAERARPTWARALGAALAVLLLGLVALTQSRGASLAIVASAAAVLVVLPGRQRRFWLLAIVLAGVAGAAPWLLDVYDSVQATPGRPGDAAPRTAALALGSTAVLAGAVWAVLSAGAARLEPAAATRAARAGRIVIAVGAVLVVTAGAVEVGNPIDRAQKLEEQFTSLGTPTFAEAGSRLTSGGGNRYDYWRVAVKEFEGDPLLGVGAGGYTRDYFRLRATDEAVQQPHSLEFQVLAELGLLGVVLLVALFVGFGMATWRARRANGIAAVAGVGAIAAFLAQTSVDWLHLLPSLAGIAVALAAALLSGGDGPRRRAHPAAIVASLALLVVAVAGIGRLTLADDARRSARDELAASPAAAIADADRALRLQPGDLDALYIKAGAQAQLDRYEAARDTLLSAVEAEPSNFVPRALLGDLAARRGDDALAARRYREALRRNPRDAQLAERLERITG